MPSEEHTEAVRQPSNQEGGASRCDRRGCDCTPEYQLKTESPILHEDPTKWYLCTEHVHVAIREWRGSTNILTSRKITSGPETRQKKLVADGGQSTKETEQNSMVETENFALTDEGDHAKVYKKTKDIFDKNVYFVKVAEVYREVHDDE